jgi:hypothetical protein
MTLKDLDLTERRKLTRMSPTLISSFPGTGKSYAVEMLTEEEKQRTVVVDVEGKGLPNDFDDQYRTVVRMKPLGDIPKERAHLYNDYDNVKYKTLSELALYLRKALAHKDVDRIVMDSFTALVDQLELHYVTTSKGFTIWNSYNHEITEWFALLKEEVRFNGKYLYVLGHYRPAKADKTGKVDEAAERHTLVKGTMHYRMVESHFNCVLSVEDHKLVADNDNAWDSTRIHKELSPYESEVNSLAEFEKAVANLLNKKQ